MPAPVPRRTRQKEEKDEPPKEVPRKPVRRKMSFSTPQKAEVKPPAPKRDERNGRRKAVEPDSYTQEPRRTTRRTTRSSLEKARPEPDDDDDAVEMVGVTSFATRNIHHSAPEPSIHEPEAQEITRTPILNDSSHATSKITLPFSDTPIIDRNKALRQTTSKRRSSLGLRGRRASSLIDNGHSATPHSAVPPEEFYKHIESEGLSEPRRMKQLLTWCGERALGEKPAMVGEGSAAVLAARHIQEQLLKEFGTRSEMSDWFSREPTKKRVVLVKNPLNEGNERRIGELEERIKRYISLSFPTSFQKSCMPWPRMNNADISPD